MFVIGAIEGGNYEIVGYTSLRPSSDREVFQYTSAPPVAFSGRIRSEAIQATVHTYPIITRYGERRLLVEDGQDPTILPGWIPLRELPLEGPRVVHARDLNGHRHLLMKLPPGLFAAMRHVRPGSLRGPMYWTWQQERLHILPEPDALWGIEAEPMLGFGDIEPARELRYRHSPERIAEAYERAKDNYAVAPELIAEDPPKALAALHRVAAQILEYLPIGWFSQTGFRVAVDPALGPDRAVLAIGRADPLGRVEIVDIQPATDRLIADWVARNREQIDQALFNTLAGSETWLHRTYRELREQDRRQARSWEQDWALAGGFRADMVILDHLFIRPILSPEPISWEARDRARGLLRRLVSPEQWEQFQRAGCITEQVGDRRYTLRPGQMIDTGAEMWCVNPVGNIPPEDMLIGQLLHLRNDPEGLRRKANIFGACPGTRPMTIRWSDSLR